MARPLLCSIAASAALLVASAAFAQNGSRRGGGGEEGGEEGRQGPWSALDLDEDQAEQLRAMREELAWDLEPVQEEIEALESELGEAWDTSMPDEATILHLEQWLIYTRAAVRDRHYDLRFDMLGVLDQEQRAALAESGFDDGQDGARERGPSRRLLRQLDLDESQSEIAHQALAELEQSTELAQELLAELGEELHALWAEQWPNEDWIYEVDEDMDTVRLEIKELEVAFSVALFDILDDDQREAFVESIRNGGRGGEEGGECHGEEGQGGGRRGSGAQQPRTPA